MPVTNKPWITAIYCLVYIIAAIVMLLDLFVWRP